MPNLAPRCTNNMLSISVHAALGLNLMLNSALPRTRPPSMAIAELPDQLADWGCDTTLWNVLPPGACRDLTRYSLTGKEEMARRRVNTMREIAEVAYGEGLAKAGASWEEEIWNSVVSSWEAAEAAKEAAAVKAAKDAKAAAAKAKREAEAAAKAAAEE